jgi:hypothetical protein
MTENVDREVERIIGDVGTQGYGRDKDFEKRRRRSLRAQAKVAADQELDTSPIESKGPLRFTPRPDWIDTGTSRGQKRINSGLLADQDEREGWGPRFSDRESLREVDEIDDQYADVDDYEPSMWWDFLPESRTAWEISAGLPEDYWEVEQAERRQAARQAALETKREREAEALEKEWKAALKCSNCGRRADEAPPLRGGICNRCYVYKRRHKGELPPPTLLR